MIRQMELDHVRSEARAWKVSAIGLLIAVALLVAWVISLGREVDKYKAAYDDCLVQEKVVAVDAEVVAEEADKIIREVYQGLEACMILYDEPSDDGPEGWMADLNRDEYSRASTMRINMERLVTQRYLQYQEWYGNEEGLQRWAERSIQTSDKELTDD